ncbi:hypothetical protein FACS1894133_3200 [Clostridia bacterium]|nr:hypothetical protein FACS1894133_3200 [Clostridia bacterium]
MATAVDYIEFVAERVSAAVTERMAGGAVRYRKMFGEYMVYVNDRRGQIECIVI